MAEPLATPTNVEALIEGGSIGQIAVGRYIVKIHPQHGAVVFVVPPESSPAPRPLAEPAPHPRSSLAGRTFDLETTRQELAPLPDEEKRVLSALAAVGGGPLTLAHLAALADVEDPLPALGALLEPKLIQEDGSLYSLRGDLDRVLPSIWDLSPWCERALAYFLVWAEARREDPAALMEEAGVLRRLLDWAVESGRYAEALRLGRALDTAFAVSGRWGAWAQALARVRTASEALRDRAAEAWALHQLGTRLLCLDDKAAARQLLSHALAIRRSLGDREGAAVTRHNLGLLAPLSSSRGVFGPPIPSRLLPWLALALLVLVFAGIRLWSSRAGESTRLARSVVPPTPISSDQEAPLETTPIPPATIEEKSDLTSDEMTTGNLAPLTTEPPPEETNRPILQSPPSLDFPAVVLGSASASQVQTLAVTNAGNSPLVIAGVSFKENPEQAFTARSNCVNKPVAPKDRCSILISFRPLKAGSYHATLAIDAEGRERRTVEISGEATEPGKQPENAPRTREPDPASSQPPPGEPPPAVQGWCCADGEVTQSSGPDCNEHQGRFFRQQRAALAACLMTGCCIDGEFKLGETRDECREKGGTFMSATEVAARCHQPQEGWCCLPGGNLVHVSQDACERGKGGFFESKAEAQRQCSPQ